MNHVNLSYMLQILRWLAVLYGLLQSWTACQASGLGNFRLRFGVFLRPHARTSKKMMPKQNSRQLDIFHSSSRSCILEIQSTVRRHSVRPCPGTRRPVCPAASRTPPRWTILPTACRAPAFYSKSGRRRASWTSSGSGTLLPCCSYRLGVWSCTVGLMFPPVHTPIPYWPLGL